MHTSRCWTHELAVATILAPLPTEQRRSTATAGRAPGVQLDLGQVPKNHALVVNGYTNYLNLPVLEYSETADFPVGATGRLTLGASTTRVIMPVKVFARVFWQPGQAQILQQETVQAWIEDVRNASNEVER